ncbi:hypothetical protein [Micromonospora sp. NPDC004551]|uniref:hypothetical protein n=1 Tax=Micromonospora sp. NPDC004551 TaxID=3154284 RepID=UPI0033A812E2
MISLTAVVAAAAVVRAGRRRAPGDSTADSFPVRGAGALDTGLSSPLGGTSTGRRDGEAPVLTRSAD